MSIRSSLKKIVPRPLWRLAKSLSRTLDLLAADRSLQICADHDIGSGAIAFSDDLIVWCPDNAVANAIFRWHFFERTHRAEIRNFLTLSEGCTNLIDLGASGGIFSVVFARSRAGYNILSVEPDQPSLAILEQTRARNHSPGNYWTIEPSLLSDAARSVIYESSGYGGEIAHPTNRARLAARLNRAEYQTNSRTTETLISLVDRTGFKPDVIKLDIEGYEYEVICSSSELLQKFRPRLALELHVERLRDRGLDATRVLGVLGDIGYRGFPGGGAIESFVRAAAHDSVLRITLAA